MRGEYHKDSNSDVAFPLLESIPSIPDAAFRGCSICSPGPGILLDSVTVAGEIAGFTFTLDGNKWATAVTPVDTPGDMSIETLEGTTAGVLLAGDGIVEWISSLLPGTTPLRAALDPSVITVIPGITGLRHESLVFHGHVAIAENGGIYMRENSRESEYTAINNPRILVSAIGHRDMISVIWPLDREVIPSGEEAPIPLPFGFDILPDPFSPADAGRVSVTIRFTSDGGLPVILTPSAAGDITFARVSDGANSWLSITGDRGGITIGLRGQKR